MILILTIEPETILLQFLKKDINNKLIKLVTFFGKLIVSLHLCTFEVNSHKLLPLWYVIAIQYTNLMPSVKQVIIFSHQF